MTRLGLSLGAALLALPLPAAAQDLALSGAVADQTGGVLPGVTATVGRSTPSPATAAST